MSFVQAARRPEDGGVTVKRADVEGFWIVSVTSAGKEESILMSEFNASRVFAVLGVMLAEGGARAALKSRRKDQVVIKPLPTAREYGAPR